MNLDRFKAELEKLAEREMGLTPGMFAERKAKGLCIHCGLSAKERCHSQAGLNEFAITGSCEICFDAMFSVTE